MIAIHRTAFACVWRNWAVVLAWATLLEFVDQFLEGSSNFGGTLVAGSVFAYYVHRNLLLGESIGFVRQQQGVRPPEVGRFDLVNVVTSQATRVAGLVNTIMAVIVLAWLIGLLPLSRRE